MKISKEVWAMGLGPAVGLVVPAFLKTYVEPNYGALVPLIGETLGDPWGRWSIFVPLVTGAIFIAVPFLVKSKKITTPVKYFLGTSGVTMVVNSVINATMFPAYGARARAQTMRASMPIVHSRPAAIATTGGGGMTPTGISGKIIYS